MNSRFIILLLFVFWCIVVALLGQLTWIDAYFWGGFLGISGIIIFVFRISNRRDYDFLAPSKLVGIIYTSVFLIPSLTHYLTGNYIRPHDIEVDKSLANALWYVLLSAVCFYLGYYGCKAQYLAKKLPSPRVPNRHRLKIAMVLCGVLGWVSYSLFLQLNGGILKAILYETPRWANVRVGTGYFFWGLLWIISFIVLLWVYAIYSRTQRHVILGILISIIAFGALSLLGGRARALAPVFILLIIIHYCVKRISLREIAILAVIFFVYSVGLDMFRGGNKIALLQHPIASFQKIIRFERMFGVMAADQDRSEAVMVALEQIPHHHEYLYGQTLIAGFLGGPILNRLNLPLLHSPSPGVKLVRLIYPGLAEYWGMNPTIVGEFYMNFSLFGVAGASFGFGLLFATLYGWLQLNRSNPAVVGLYAIALYYGLRIFTEEFYKLFEFQVVFWPTMLLLYWSRSHVRKLLGVSVTAKKSINVNSG